MTARADGRATAGGAGGRQAGEGGRAGYRTGAGLLWARSGRAGDSGKLDGEAGVCERATATGRERDGARQQGRRAKGDWNVLVQQDKLEYGTASGYGSGGIARVLDQESRRRFRGYGRRLTVTMTFGLHASGDSTGFRASGHDGRASRVTGTGTAGSTVHRGARASTRTGNGYRRRRTRRWKRERHAAFAMRVQETNGRMHDHGHRAKYAVSPRAGPSFGSIRRVSGSSRFGMK